MHVSSQRPLRMIIADDHPMMLMGVRTLLSTCPRYEIVGEATSGEEALALSKRLNPDLVILDISLPGISGLDAAGILSSEQPEVKVIILSMYEDHEYVLQFIRSGATAYVLKNNSPEELLVAIEAVDRGQAYFSPSIAGRILKEQQQFMKHVPPVLHERERQVLVHLARGLMTKEIAEKLDVSVRTVQKHREHIMAKLELHSVADLTRYAIAHKLIEIDSR